MPLGYTVFCWPFFPIKDLWMCGITPEGEGQKRVNDSSISPHHHHHRVVNTHTQPMSQSVTRQQVSGSSQQELVVNRQHIFTVLATFPCLPGCVWKKSSTKGNKVRANTRAHTYTRQGFTSTSNSGLDE